MGPTEHPYFLCTECINMLQEIEEFHDMLRLSDIFWKKYPKIEPSIDKQLKFEPYINIDEGNMQEHMNFKSCPPQEAEMVIEEISNEIKPDKNIFDIEMKRVELSNDISTFERVHTVDKIAKSCDFCDKDRIF